MLSLLRIVVDARSYCSVLTVVYTLDTVAYTLLAGADGHTAT